MSTAPQQPAEGSHHVDVVIYNENGQVGCVCHVCHFRTQASELYVVECRCAATIARIRAYQCRRSFGYYFSFPLEPPVRRTPTSGGALALRAGSSTANLLTHTKRAKQ
jgi:hypothetical protein